MDGIIVINKEKEYTSHDVVAKLKKKLNILKQEVGKLIIVENYTYKLELQK